MPEDKATLRLRRCGSAPTRADSLDTPDLACGCLPRDHAEIVIAERVEPQAPRRGKQAAGARNLTAALPNQPGSDSAQRESYADRNFCCSADEIHLSAERHDWRASAVRRF